MSLQSHIAYGNKEEINSLYTQYVSGKIEVEEMKKTTLTSKVIAIIGALTGSVGSRETKENIRRTADTDVKKAVELTREFIENRDVPRLGETDSDIGYNKYVGEVNAYYVPENGMIRLEGESHGEKFLSYTSENNWTSGSYKVRADSQNPQRMNIYGIAYPTAASEDNRDVWKFFVIYQNEGRFLIPDE